MFALIPLDIAFLVSLFGSYVHASSCKQWKHEGCFPDEDPDVPLVNSGFGCIDMNGPLTAESCQSICSSVFLSVAGITEGDLCCCGRVRPKRVTTSSQPVCNPCAADSNQFCGGAATMSVYSCADDQISAKKPVLNLNSELDYSQQSISKQSGTLANLAAAVAMDQNNGMAFGTWQHIGHVYQEAGRLTPVRKFYKKETFKALDSPETCSSVCSKNFYQYAGIGYQSSKHECYCGRVKPKLSREGFPKVDLTARKPCRSHLKSRCGGQGYVDIYGFQECSWHYNGCKAVKEKPFLSNEMEKLSNLTPKACMNECIKRGYTIAGLRGKNCYCDSKYAYTPSDSEACILGCGDGSGTTCGGQNGVDVFECTPHKSGQN